MAEVDNFANIIVPVPVPELFTYSVPDKLKGRVHVGSQVVVSFGDRKFHTGIVESFSPTVPPRLADNGVEIKDIEDVTCDRPVVTAEQLRLWAWMADYYLCNIGDVYKAAVPVRMRMESETIRTRCTKTPPMRIAMRLPIQLPVMEPTAMQSARDQTTSPLMMKTQVPWPALPWSSSKVPISRGRTPMPYISAASPSKRGMWTGWPSWAGCSWKGSDATPR